MVVATKGADGYETVHDDDVLEYVKKAFSQSMSDFMDEVEEFAVESDFMAELNAIMEDTDTQTEENTADVAENVESDYYFAPFDVERYIQQSQDHLFIEANTAYIKDDYAKALELFKAADEQGNIFAAVHIGMMYYYGYGCSSLNTENQKT